MCDHTVRRADASEADLIAELLLSSRRASEIPPSVHSDDEVRAWVSELLVPACEVWVATTDGEVVGMMALDDEWVEQLYIAPGHQRRGHGARLLDLAQSTRRSLALWTFESNLAAQRFYEAHGFTRSGSPSADNEERAPAICYRWQDGVRPGR
jgi:ribosomal protein S18 acetylase RimI-like enzyme